MAKDEGKGIDSSFDVKKVILELRLDEDGIALFASNLEKLMKNCDMLADEITGLISQSKKQKYILWYNAGLDYSNTLKIATKVAKNLSKQLDANVVPVAVTDGSHTRLEAVYS